MNEIERAIELLEEISYNMGLERDTEYAGDAEKFHALCDKKSLIDLATDLCRAELSRQENAPLTCTWCKHEADRLVSAHCTRCTRLPFRTDRFEQRYE